MARQWGSVSQRIVENVAERTGTDPMRLPPLYDVIDPGALETCIEEMDEGEISFVYAGQYVTVTPDGTTTVEDTVPRYPSADPALSDD